MSKHIIFLVAIFLSVHGFAVDLEQSRQIYNDGIAKIEANTTAKDRLDESYLLGIQQLINTYKGKADFEAVKALMGEQARFQLEKSVGAKLSYCKELQEDYQEKLSEQAVAKIKDKITFSQRYLLSLKRSLASAMKSNNMNEAADINAEIKAIEFNVADLSSQLPKAPYPPDAAEFGKHHYMFFSKSITWLDAKRECEQMGGYLACITSSMENKFVYKLAEGRDVWLGGTDAGHEGKWEWVSGEPFRYKNWIANQPDNFEGREDSIHIWGRLNTAQWNDVWHGWSAEGYICEWDE